MSSSTIRHRLDGTYADEGRFAVTGRPEDHGAFRTPTVREVARTAPYIHDGSIPTPEDVIEHYDRGGVPNPQLDPEIRPLHLTAAENTRLSPSFARSSAKSVFRAQLIPRALSAQPQDSCARP